MIKAGSAQALGYVRERTEEDPKRSSPGMKIARLSIIKVIDLPQLLTSDQHRFQFQTIA